MRVWSRAWLVRTSQANAATSANIRVLERLRINSDDAKDLLIISNDSSLLGRLPSETLAASLSHKF